MDFFGYYFISSIIIFKVQFSSFHFSSVQFNTLPLLVHTNYGLPAIPRAVTQTSLLARARVWVWVRVRVRVS